MKEIEIIMIARTQTKASLLSALIQEHTANLVIIWSIHAENKLQSKKKRNIHFLMLNANTKYSGSQKQIYQCYQFSERN